MPGEPPYNPDVALLCSFRKTAQLHVLDHTGSELRHDVLLAAQGADASEDLNTEGSTFSGEYWKEPRIAVVQSFHQKATAQRFSSISPHFSPKRHASGDHDV